MAHGCCGGLHPDHSTVAEFVRRNSGAALALLPESVKACAREGLVSPEVVAGDGTMLKANAAMASNVTREQLDAPGSCGRWLPDWPPALRLHGRRRNSSLVIVARG